GAAAFAGPAGRHAGWRHRSAAGTRAEHDDGTRTGLQSVSGEHEPREGTTMTDPEHGDPDPSRTPDTPDPANAAGGPEGAGGAEGAGEAGSPDPGAARRAAEPDRIRLYGQDAALRRKRVAAGLVGVVLFAAAFGGIAGLIGGTGPGLVVAGVIALLLGFVIVSNARRQVWLEGRTVVMRSWGRR